MNILDQIIAHKRKEVGANKELYPAKLLEQSTYFSAKPISLRAYIERQDKSGVIAEIKRKSPSRGMMNEFLSVEELSVGYMQAGASALSVLTDREYFGGGNTDLVTARRFNYCPILRKDFVVDEYQIVEAKSIGADAVLLIARVLSSEEIKQFTKLATEMGMEVLLEVHNREEFERSYLPEITLVGVNNRDLDTLTTDVNISRELISLLPADACKVTESGISDVNVAVELAQLGYQGFLIGEAFMRTPQPHRTCARFIAEFQRGLQGRRNA